VGQQAKPNNMQQRTVVHAFKEAPAADPAIAIKLPAVYLGVFEAKDVTENTVILSPLLPPDAEQRSEWQDANATWALYESMPTDNFAPFDQLTDEQLKLLFPVERTGMTAAEYDQLIKSYVRTGGPYDANDRPEDKWVKVKFTKPHKVKVNSDSQGLILVDGGAFDAEGRALLPGLRRLSLAGVSEEVEFTPGAMAIFYADDDATRQLISDRTCELIEELYYRPLNDYSFMFHQRFSRIEEVNTRLKEIARDMANLKKANTEVEKQIAVKTEEKAKVQSDLNAAKYELASVNKYHADLVKELAAVRNQCNELYRTNKKLGQELAEINAKLTDEINAKTRSATASTN
jgi:predicted transcriptional regulator